MRGLVIVSENWGVALKNETVRWCSRNTQGSEDERFQKIDPPSWEFL